MCSFRLEKDSMGEILIPTDALYSAQTRRAVINFPISGLRFPRSFIKALGMLKALAAESNLELGLLDRDKALAIRDAARAVAAGDHDEQFVVDIFQTGSGTSTNMNANEVIARLAQMRLSDAVKVHPNDDVNLSQSSNDVIPSAMHVAAAFEISFTLIPALRALHASLETKAVEFDKLIKTGRTHLQDATPIRLGQEFGGWASQVLHGIERVERTLPTLYELALGGTAVGTGINTHPQFAALVSSKIAAETRLPFVEARNHFEAQSAKDAVLETSGQLRVIAGSLAKAANDIRWLASGPRCGLAEIFLPEVQPGSSIMPGKVNPVICESLLMVWAQVTGNDAAIAAANSAGSIFELNTMMPVIAYNLLQSIELLASSAENFCTKCVDGIRPNEPRLRELAEASIASCTALAPYIGYDKAAVLAKEAYQTGESVRALAEKKAILPKEQLEQILNLERMTEPG